MQPLSVGRRGGYWALAADSAETVHCTGMITVTVTVTITIDQRMLELSGGFRSVSTGNWDAL